jgi:hypothetical protein
MGWVNESIPLTASPERRAVAWATSAKRVTLRPLAGEAAPAAVTPPIAITTAAANAAGCVIFLELRITDSLNMLVRNTDWFVFFRAVAPPARSLARILRAYRERKRLGCVLLAA